LPLAGIHVYILTLFPFLFPYIFTTTIPQYNFICTQVTIDDIRHIHLYVRVRARVRAFYVVMECDSYHQYVTMGECAKGKTKLSFCSHIRSYCDSKSPGSGIAECSSPAKHAIFEFI
jgi:hypothetical protein